MIGIGTRTKRIINTPNLLRNTARAKRNKYQKTTLLMTHSDNENKPHDWEWKIT